MKKSRRFLILLLLLIIVTGGVYATWTYATRQAVDKEINGNSIDVEEAIVTERGVIAVGSNTFKITFNDVNANHVVENREDEIVITGEDLTVSFTVNDGSSINTQESIYHLNITVVSELIYNDIPVISFTKIPLELTKSEGSVYSGIITKAILQSMVSEVALELPTITDHTNFKASLAAASFTLVISDDYVAMQ